VQLSDRLGGQVERDRREPAGIGEVEHLGWPKVTIRKIGLSTAGRQGQNEVDQDRQHWIQCPRRFKVRARVASVIHIRCAGPGLFDLLELTDSSENRSQRGGVFDFCAVFVVWHVPGMANGWRNGSCLVAIGCHTGPQASEII